MGEIKSVKVDNWGVFFLQKLQNFFNKTDYCDLTLQFRDNSQLKVHRLVLSACTDYFNVLEHTCEVVDDALIMPNELQADVVVPIVNFMYTGTLEFELRMYGKLLRTAKEMNMTVLLKLLEAHRRTMEGVNRQQRPPSPKTIRRRGPVPQIPSNQQQTSQYLPQRRVVPSQNSQQAVNQQKRIIQTKPTTTATSGVQTHVRQLGQTTLTRTTVSSSQQSGQQIKHDTQTPQSSTFEQLRKGYNNNKRPANSSFISPQSKKPNIEDVKEFAEQQRMRKQIAAEYGDDQEYEGIMDDDIHADDDDDDTGTANAFNSPSTSNTQSNRGQQTQSGETTITIKHDNEKGQTVVVKDSSNSKVNHAKIISEVLRQYPHLAKGNKNIKLKIMPNSGGQPHKIVVKREALDESPQQPTLSTKPLVTSQTVIKPSDKTTIGTTAQSPAAVSKPQTPETAGGTRRRIDSKTMHALIALGAENTTGPWLCLRCGVNGRPISIPTYRGFRRHLVHTHKETIDSALCEHCGWRSTTNRDLHFHIQVEHKIRSSTYTYPECLLCADLFLDTNALNQHMLTSHPNANKQQCIYCNKIFGQESQLFAHMKAYHKRQALEDGIIDYSDEEFVGNTADDHEMDTLQKKRESKIKILSDISLPNTSPLLKLDQSSEAAALSTVASGIATSIAITSSDGTEEFITAIENQQAGIGGGTVTKFVNAEGNEMVLTDDLRKEIMSQLNQDQEGHGGVVMVLNENQYADGEGQSVEGATTETDETEKTQDDEDEPMETGEDEQQSTNQEDEYDDSQIYGEFLAQPSTSEGETKKSNKAKENLDENKDSEMEWAENIVTAHEMSDDGSTKATDKKPIEETSKKNDNINDKIKELTGDWSDDDENDVDLQEETEEHDDKCIEDEQSKTSADVKEETVLKEETSTSASGAEEKFTTVEEKSLPSRTASNDADDLELAMENLHKDNDNGKDEKGNVADIKKDVTKEIKDDTKNDEDENTEDSVENDDNENKENGRKTLKDKDSTVAELSEVGFFVDFIKKDEKLAPKKEKCTVDDDEFIAIDKEDNEFNIKTEDGDEVEDDDDDDVDVNTEAPNIKTDIGSTDAEKDVKTTSKETEEKMKSLISEWAVEDVDDEEEEGDAEGVVEAN